MKNSLLLFALGSLVLFISCQERRANTTGSQDTGYDTVSQVLPLDTSRSEMPVMKPDTSDQAAMPTIGPPDSIQHK
jgi:hypothetical protein